MKRNRISRTDPPAILFHVTGDRIGDALIKWPVLKALKQALPDHRIVWVAGRRRSVFAGPLATLVDGVLDEVHDCVGLGVHWSEFARRAPEFSATFVVATEPKLRSTLLLRRLPHRVFISPALGFRLSDRRPGYRYPPSAFEQIRCLATLVAGHELNVPAHIDLPTTVREQARVLLPGGPRYIGFSPGSAGASKRWPLERFLALADRALACGAVPVFFLGPEEENWRAAIRSHHNAILFPEYDERVAARGPLLSIALAERLVAGVANDAGGGHILAAGGRPLITLFGHTSAEKFRPPYGERIAICAQEFGGKEMARIPVERVWQDLESLLIRSTHEQ